VGHSPNEHSNLENNQEHILHRSPKASLPGIAMFWQMEDILEMRDLITHKAWEQFQLIFQNAGGLFDKCGENTEAPVFGVHEHTTEKISQFILWKFAPKEENPLFLGMRVSRAVHHTAEFMKQLSNCPD
jgi:hypothetical protein